MPLDRGRGNAVGGETLAQKSGIVGQQQIGGVGFEEGPVVPRAVGLIAIRQLQRAIEGIGVRP